VTEGATSVQGWAPAGSQLQVGDVSTGTVIGVGTALAGGRATISLTQPLILGHRYSAMVGGQVPPPERAITCVCRHGYSEVFSDGTQIRDMYYQLGSQIGLNFTLEVGLHNDDPPVGGMLYSGAMLIGFRVGGVDPIVSYGNNVLLASGLYVPARGMVSDINGWGLTFASIPIPNDPGLVGLIFLAQFAMEDGASYRLSQVYGSTIDGLTSSGASAPGIGGAAALLHAEAHVQEAIPLEKIIESTPLLLDILSRR
jgi:hypothetical protein